MEFIVEIADSETNCILQTHRFDADIQELFSMLNLQTAGDHCVYELDHNQAATIKKRFGLDLNANIGQICLRQAYKFDDLPYQLHTNRELNLMLAGIKPLAVFVGAYLPMKEELPESQFDPYVEKGRFTKREYVERQEHCRVLVTRTILYALPSESWRIEAYILLMHTAMKTGWSEGLERMQGSLLGYEEWQNDAYIDLGRRP